MAWKISRRRLLAGSATGVAGMATAGCSFFSTSSKKSSHNNANGNGNATANTAAKEAPMLAALVKKGSLPPLEKRLPANPRVVKPLERTGVYGGTIRRALEEQSDSGAMFPCRVGIVEWGLTKYEPTPALAESWKITNGGRSTTFTLRKGLKWSDGHPFTTDDIAFYFEDFLGNATLSPVPPTWFVINGKPGKFTKLDETSFRLDFDAPHALLLRYLSFYAVSATGVMPKHYLSKYHPHYNDPKTLKSAAKKAGFSSWDQYFDDRSSWLTNTDLPVMGAWKVTNAPTGAANHAVLERNPYYWKVDTDGRQLPYVDRIAYDYMDQQAIALRAASGEIDLQFRLINYQSAPVLLKNADKNNFEVRRWTLDAPWVGLNMNQSAKDPVLRKLMQNRDFRAAMSYAINREEMNQTLFFGEGRMDQPGPIKQDPYYLHGYGHTFTEHDVDKANKLLDSIGLDKRNGDNWRLRPDGKPLELNILTFDYKTGSPTKAYDMVVGYWQKVGVKASYKVVTQDLWVTRVEDGDVDVPGYTVDGYYWDIYPNWWVPTANNCYWAPLYGEWYATGGTDGEKPPPELKRLQTLYKQMQVTLDEKKRLELGHEIIKAHNENVWIIGTVGMPFQPTVVSKDLVNVANKAIATYTLSQDEVTWFEQVFYKNPQEH